MQVTKDPVAGKGPRVSTAVSLAGRTLVYLPTAREVGVSRRITDQVERERLRADPREPAPGAGASSPARPPSGNPRRSSPPITAT